MGSDALTRAQVEVFDCLNPIPPNYDDKGFPYPAPAGFQRFVREKDYAALAAVRAEEREANKACRTVCEDILDIMKTYHEQETSKFGVGTPGGLEHMGDVWNKFHKWEEQLKAIRTRTQ